jgi:putative transposase
MARPPRFSYPRAVHHVTLRCNNREFLFAEPWFARFAELLQEARAKFPIRLFDYCVMTNHVHLLLQVGHADTLPEVMHWLSTSFVRRFNKATSRYGHLWEGRYRSTIIEQATYFLRCMAYVDLNPVRAGIVAVPGDYPWCGHRALSLGGGGVLDLHELYLGLGGDEATRYRAYLDFLAEEAQRPGFSLARVHFVGSPRFVARMEARFGVQAGERRVRHIRAGRGVVASVPLQGTQS